jgi:hypothetical protein
MAKMHRPFFLLSTVTHVSSSFGATAAHDLNATSVWPIWNPEHFLAADSFRYTYPELADQIIVSNVFLRLFVTDQSPCSFKHVNVPALAQVRSLLINLDKYAYIYIYIYFYKICTAIIISSYPSWIRWAEKIKSRVHSFILGSYNIRWRWSHWYADPLVVFI